MCSSRTRHFVRIGRLPAHVALVVGILAFLPVSPARSQSTSSADAQVAFNIPAGNLADALDQFSTHTGIQLTYASTLVAGKQAKALSGRLTWQDALNRLLQGSGLEYSQINANTLTLRKSEAKSEPPAARAGVSPSKSAESSQRPVTEIAGITVTGTRIRGGDTPSPVLTISAENIREEGFDDLGQVVRSVPQNFSGGQNPEVPGGNLLGGGVANQNITGGSGLNLRGLGPDATLTLINGRRMSYSGFSQAIDISMIPVEAVDRIEIVPDGASAIYGSDAVGGVGNVVLKRDFDGVTLGARYGGATDGGLTTRDYTATAGTAWSNGGLIASYKDSTTDPIYADERDYTHYLSNPRTIYPSGDLRSALFSAHQALGDAVELRLDTIRAIRDQLNSFYVSNLPQYYRLATETATTWISPSIEFSLPGDWWLSVGGAWGRDKSVPRQSLVNAATSAQTLTYNVCYCNDMRLYEIGAEGPLFTLPGGDARLAVGAGSRTNQYSQTNYLTPTSTFRGDESSRFSYAEINLPFIGAESNIVGVRRLVVTAAARSENYESFGHVTTPQLGVIYGPSDDFTLKGSWGRSFKAPTLYQRYFAATAVLYPPAALGGSYPAGSTALYVVGGDRDLKPERARTETASLAFHPEAIPNLQAELTWFDIDYTDRVVQPISNAAQALSNPLYAPFVALSPTADTQEEVLSGVDSFLNYAGAAYDPSKVVAIVYGRYVNVGQQRIKGVDLSGSYRFDFAAGELVIRGSASWLDSSQQLSSTLPSFNLAGTLFNPAKLNARLGVLWNRAGFTVSVFGNYTGGVLDTVNDVKGSSFTTFDTTLRYRTGQRDDVWSGLEFAFSAQNLLDRKPPLYAPASVIYSTPYDPTNYSAVGRFLSLSASKHW